MDLNKLVARAKAILLTPKTEWPVIATEPTTVADIYKGYIVPLAAIPVLFGFLHMSVIGVPIMFAGTYRVGIGPGLGAMVLRYVLSLVSVYVTALIIDALAPTFGGQKNNIQALKTIAYAATASWVASIAQIVPGIGWLVAIAAVIYSIYLLYLGLPHTMKCPPEKAGGYAAVTILVAVVLWFVTAMVVGTVAGVGASMGGATYSSTRDADVHFDEDSPLGKMEKWSKGVEAAGKQLEQAQQSGDQAAQEAALKTMVGAALGGGSQVESLAPDRLQAFVPEELAGLARSSMSSERNSAMGLQISQATAAYADDSRQVTLEITDAGTAQGLLGLAAWAGVEGEKHANGRYEKTFRKDDRLVHEEWDSSGSSGQYVVVVGNRFTVKVEGQADNVGELRDAMESLDLDGLEALRTEGVKH